MAAASRVSELLRDETIAALTEHYARGSVDVADFERRVENAEHARSDAELTLCLDGLPALERAARTPVPASEPVPAVSAVLGDANRRGRWRVPPRLSVSALLGRVDLDLSEAELARGETLLEVDALMGRVTVVVPAELAVEVEGTALLGRFDHLAQPAASRRDARRLRIVGRARLGRVDIVVKPRRSLVEGIRALLTGR